MIQSSTKVNVQDKLLASSETFPGVVNNTLPYQLIAFLLLHIPLALLMDEVPQIANLHAILVFTIGIIWSVSGKNLDRVVYTVAYIVGAEVLWRMTGAQVFWEFGKYAIIALLIIAMFRYRRFSFEPLSLFYFLFLLPAVILLFDTSLFSDIRRQLSFNLSGPFALTICVWFFSKQVFAVENRDKLFLTIAAPILGIATIALKSVISTENLHFSLASNLITSGDFGPNQVSSILSLGAVALYLYLVISRPQERAIKVILFLVFLALVSQSILTFSRSGPYFMTICILVSSVALAQQRETRIRLFGFGLVFLALLRFILIPWLNEFTDGFLLMRLSDTGLTGRDEIWLVELNIWRQHFFGGIGPGQAPSFYPNLLTFNVRATHNEFTRMLAEHGLLGLISLLLLLLLLTRSFIRKKDSHEHQAIVNACLAWAFMFMFINAMRLAAPSFLIGLATSQFLSE